MTLLFYCSLQYGGVVSKIGHIHRFFIHVEDRSLRIARSSALVDRGKSASIVTLQYYNYYNLKEHYWTLLDVGG